MSQISKFLALVLRHQPEMAGVTLDPEGWVEVEGLLRGLSSKGMNVDRADLERIVAEDSKQRYALKGDWMRANQGHSVAGVCAVELVPMAPPQVLYHGTTRERWTRIRASGGLNPGQRHHVHLSATTATARQVAERYRAENPILLQVRAADYAAAGGLFYRSENQVWLIEFVPLEYLEEC